MAYAHGLTVKSIVCESRRVPVSSVWTEIGYIGGTGDEPIDPSSPDYPEYVARYNALLNLWNNAEPDPAGDKIIYFFVSDDIAGCLSPLGTYAEPIDRNSLWKSLATPLPAWDTMVANFPINAIPQHVVTQPYNLAAQGFENFCVRKIYDLEYGYIYLLKRNDVIMLTSTQCYDPLTFGRRAQTEMIIVGDEASYVNQPIVTPKGTFNGIGRTANGTSGAMFIIPQYNSQAFRAFFPVFSSSYGSAGFLETEFSTNRYSSIPAGTFFMTAKRWGDTITTGVLRKFIGVPTDVKAYPISFTHDGGVMSYTGPEEAYKDDSVTYLITANPGTRITDVTVYPTIEYNLTHNNDEYTLTFTMPENAVGITVTTSYDPNEEAGTSEPGGGEGTHDETSDIITIPDLPTVNASNAGLITLFNPTITELQSLGNYLWTDFMNVVENFQRIFSNPMDYFIALNIVPVAVTQGERRNIKMGLWESNVEMATITNQFVRKDCGSVTISPFWGSYLDYSPYTRISLMLPYIGQVHLDTDEVMGKTVNLTYHVDILSGACVALVSVNNSVMYQFSGECATSIPLTASDYSRIYGGILGAVASIATGVTVAGAAGAAGALADQKIANQTGRTITQLGNTFNNSARYAKGIPGVSNVRQNVLSAMNELSVNANAGSGTAQAARAAITARSVASTVSHVMGSKLIISHAGQLSGASGLLGVKQAFLIIEYPNQSLPQNYKHFVGYPSNITSQLSKVSGYTEVEKIEIKGFPGTDGELAELYDLLEGGVYV